MYIDSHAHLFVEEYRADRDDVIHRARSAGVDRIVVPGTTLETSREAVALAEQYDLVFAAVGFHPHDAANASDEGLSEIEELSAHEKVVAIGEIGLDFHYDFSPRDVQQQVFEKQIAIAVRRDLPIIVHTRESIAEAMLIVGQVALSTPKWKKRSASAAGDLVATRGVFHCFSGDTEQCKRLFELGFFVSYPGIVTFKNSPVIETIKSIGVRNLLIETDSPYMTPVPFRGKRNEPAHVRLVGEKISEALELSVTEVAVRTSANATLLFDLPEIRESNNGGE